MSIKIITIKVYIYNTYCTFVLSYRIYFESFEGLSIIIITYKWIL